jgi:hypothetical protein
MGKRAKPRAKTHPDVEIRYHDDGTVDEIIVKKGDICLLHLEQMADERYWIGLAPKEGNYPVHVDMCSDKPITARVRIA